MRGLRWLGPSLLVAGIAALAIGLLQGEATLNLFVIFPVITATGAWSGLGILLVIAGFFAFFLTWPAYGVADSMARERPAAPGMSAPPTSGETTLPRRWGGVVFLGPVPLVFGSDPQMAKWMIVAGFLLLAALVVLTIIALGVI